MKKKINGYNLIIKIKGWWKYVNQKLLTYGSSPLIRFVPNVVFILVHKIGQMNWTNKWLQFTIINLSLIIFHRKQAADVPAALIFSNEFQYKWLDWIFLIFHILKSSGFRQPILITVQTQGYKSEKFCTVKQDNEFTFSVKG